MATATCPHPSLLLIRPGSPRLWEAADAGAGCPVASRAFSDFLPRPGPCFCLISLAKACCLRTDPWLKVEYDGRKNKVAGSGGVEKEQGLWGSTSVQICSDILLAPDRQVTFPSLSLLIVKRYLEKVSKRWEKIMIRNHMKSTLLLLVITALGWRILVPGPGIKPVPPAMEVWSLNQWTAGKSFLLPSFLVCSPALRMEPPPHHGGGHPKQKIHLPWPCSPLLPCQLSLHLTLHFIHFTSSLFFHYA